VKSQDVVPSIQLEEADGCEAINSCPEDRVDSRKNAPMTPAGRLRMVRAVLNGEPARSVALRLATDRKTVRKWMVRYRVEGEADGFARARCGQCGHDFLIAFSCKGAACAHRATAGAWWRPRRISPIMSCRRCRCGSGCSRCPSACATGSTSTSISLGGRRTGSSRSRRRNLRHRSSKVALSTARNAATHTHGVAGYR
jgi:hypothetical protein